MKALSPLEVELSGQHLIEASAGTGKTHTITTLYLRLLLERRLAVSQILVVTFTNAATAELRTRIRARLRVALDAIGSGRTTRDGVLDELLARRADAGMVGLDRQVLEAALHSFDEAAIFTIHAFCQRVLQDHAFASGAAFDQKLLGDQTALLDEVVQDFWVREVCADEDLAPRDASGSRRLYGQLATLGARAARYPNVPILPERADVEVEAARGEFERACAAASLLWDGSCEEIVASLRAALPRLWANVYKAELIPKWKLEMDRALAGALPGLTEKFEAFENFCAEVIAKRTKSGFPPPRHAFFDACQGLLAADARLKDALGARRVALGIELVDWVRRELPRRKEAAGVRFFDDLLHAVDRALASAEGRALARGVRERHPAALIDEFQDTDPEQYRIFHAIYTTEGFARPEGSAGSLPDAALFLIGDPKQAIYAFRGADVFAYMDAKRDAERAHTLEVNWRSDPSLVRAVNCLFGRARQPFLFDEIPFRPVVVRDDARDAMPGRAALEILFAPQSLFSPGKWISKQEAERRLPAMIAAEIARLLARGERIGERAVVPSDIAVLCRKNAQAVATQAALRALGIPSVLQGDASVFDAPEAEELERLLRALAEPGDASRLIAALSTPMLGLDAAELLALQEDEAAWDRWAERFQRWHELWRARGFIPALRRLLDECEVQRRLLGLRDGERRLTNVLHLGELLQTSVEESRRGPLALVEWLAEMRQSEEARAELGSEAAQIRLESDAQALTLTTVHRSKGLQYPVVYCPFLWDGRLLSDEDKRCLGFHDPDDGNRRKLDLGSEDVALHTRSAEREAMAENLRLLYVALTRAKHRCSVVWGRFNHCATSPLAYLLHQPDGLPVHQPDGLPVHQPDGADVRPVVESRVKNANERQMRDDLARLASAAAGAIAVGDLSADAGPPYRAGESPELELRARVATRTLSSLWRTGSFSSLVAAGAANGSAADLGVDRDQEANEPSASLPVALAEALPLGDFPGGTRSGLLLHQLFEDIDFPSADAAVLGAAAARLVDAYGLQARWAEPIRDAIGEVLDTPLDDAASPLRLRDVAAARRLAELEFVLPVAHAADRGVTFTSGRLADALARRGGDLFRPAYLDSVRRLGFAPLSGFLRGYIDLVFEHGGRWYVVDYKSNLLGPSAADYGSAGMARAMEHHHYFLQYHLYVVAVHRYLALRVPGYDYDRHFGSALYLFVRGMSPRHPRGCGVFSDRPPRRLVEELSALLDGDARRGGTAPRQLSLPLGGQKPDA